MATTLSWKIELASPAADVWEVLSDTDAFNRAAGLDFQFERDGDVMRGTTTVLGVRSTWVEEPFTWERPNRFVNRRTYDSGPVHEATATCRLDEGPSGTTVHYQVHLEPRNLLARPMVAVLAQTTIRPGLDRALKRAVAAIRGEAPLDPPPELTPEQRTHLSEGLAAIDSSVRAALVRRIESLPLRLQQCLRPLQIAHEDGLDPIDVVTGCVRAAAQGALRMELQVLCPRCRGAHRKQTWLELEVQGVHCPSCNISYDGSLIENVEVVFAPAAEVRDPDVPVACVFAPARTPHILAQVMVAPGGKASFDAHLSTGSYRLETRGAQVWLLAEPDAEPEDVTAALDAITFHPATLRVKPGRRRITLHNLGKSTARIALHARWRPPHALTVGQLFAWPEVRALLPESFVAGTACEVQYGSTLLLEGSSRDVELARRLLSTSYTQLVGGQRGLLLSPDPETSLQQAETLASYHLPVAIGMASGPVLRFARGERTSWAGPALEQALSALLQLRASQTAVAPEALEDTSLKQVLAAHHDDVRLAHRAPLPPLMAFSAWFDPPKTPSPLPAPKREEGAGKKQKLPPMPGDRIGAFTLLRELGKGGMGMVWEAVDHQGQRRAVKLMHRVDDPILQNLFHNESWYAQMIAHPNVVEVVEWGTCSWGPYLVLEHLVGQSLFHRLRQRRRLEQDEVTQILRGTLAALEAVHAAGLVHRDLKPGNLFLVAEPTPVPHALKLLDFGLARRSGLLDAEGIAGTPEHMAPEQLLRQAQDGRSDLYALATVGYRILAGEHAFAAKTRGKRAIHRVDADPATLDWTPIPPAMRPVLERALQPDPDARWPDARAMAEALPT